MWSCDPEGVVSVASNGTLTTVSKGTALITAADIKNTVHYDQTEVIHTFNDPLPNFHLSTPPPRIYIFFCEKKLSLYLTTVEPLN